MNHQIIHRNRNTRMAYARAVRQFFDWYEDRRLALDDIEPMTVAAYRTTWP